MKTWIALPPLKSVSGGLAVLLDLARVLSRAGFETALVARENAPWLAAQDLPPVSVWPAGGQAPGSGQAAPAAGDIWLVPEGWPSLLMPGLRAGARVLVYAQNWAYLLGEWPEGLSPAALPLHVLAVSRPVAWHVEEMTGHGAPVLRPGLDLRLFAPDGTGNARGGPGDARIRVAWMPRKNSALARRIREIVDARRARRGLPGPEWVAIQGLSHEAVAAVLRGCDLFLATGFPEGCPLPPLEAMACACPGVGFSGFGGWDYMRSPEGWQGAGADGLPPWLPETVRKEAEPRPVNGFWTADADVIGAALAVDAALGLAERGGPAWERLRDGALATAALYGAAERDRRLTDLWAQIRAGRLFG
ncbi:MAG: glycosyltransferase family 1 protein [Desulfovibrionaceae bacterium]|nr:glycosyltransferase family 1 protein [Desulfovibrionaceae bacterium]